MQDQKPSDAPAEKPDEKPAAKTDPAETSAKEALQEATAANRVDAETPAEGDESRGDAWNAELQEAEEPGDPVIELLAEIDMLRAENTKLKDQALRAMADAENTRRRAEREKGDAIKYASLPLLRDLVKVADNMSRALAHGGPESDTESSSAKALRDGVALTEKELLAAFNRHGATRIDPAGEPLNPDRHEAMFEIPDDKAEPGTIVQVLEPGWLLHGRLIRPARVGVAKKP